MPRVTVSTSVVICVGAGIAGCQSAPVHYADEGMTTSVSAVRATGGELYHGASAAVRAPLHDLNMMQDPILPVLLRAESHPYDLTGVNSCNDVLDRVAELDLALGPDVDTPKQKGRTRVNRGADFAASAALDAAGSAAEHFIPMRSTIKQLSGAQRYDNHVKHAVLSGETRRAFLKAIGMEHNCAWPAAPLQFTPTVVADAAAPWNGQPAISPSQTGGAPVVLASVIAAPRTAAAPVSRVILVSASGAPVSATPPAELAIPSAAPAAQPGQGWRPAPARATMVAVSAPMGRGSLASSGGTTASAPWSATLVSTASARP